MSNLEMDDHASQLREGTPTMADATASRGVVRLTKTIMVIHDLRPYGDDS
jgi:hypothetical protein